MLKGLRGLVPLSDGCQPLSEEEFDRLDDALGWRLTHNTVEFINEDIVSWTVLFSAVDAVIIDKASLEKFNWVRNSSRRLYEALIGVPDHKERLMSNALFYASFSPPMYFIKSVRQLALASDADWAGTNQRTRRRVDKIRNNARSLAQAIDKMEHLGKHLLMKANTVKPKDPATIILETLKLLGAADKMSLAPFEVQNPFDTLVNWLFENLKEDFRVQFSKELGLSPGGPFQRFIEELREIRPYLKIHRPARANQNQYAMYQWLKDRLAAEPLVFE